MGNELGQTVSVVVTGNGHFSKMSLCGRHSPLAIEQTEPEQCRLVVVGGSAAAGGGVGPPTQPAGGAEFLQAVLHATGTGEWQAGKGLAEPEELEDGQGATVESQKDLNIAIGEVSLNC